MRASSSSLNGAVAVSAAPSVCEHGAWVYESNGDYTRCAETGYSNHSEVWRCGLCSERFDADEMQQLAKDQEAKSCTK